MGRVNGSGPPLRRHWAQKNLRWSAAAEPKWWGGEDSNLRRLRRQIYSLFPLTAREPPHDRLELARGLEPPTTSLQVRSSTIELRQRGVSDGLSRCIRQVARPGHYSTNHSSGRSMENGAPPRNCATYAPSLGFQSIATRSIEAGCRGLAIARQGETPGRHSRALLFQEPFRRT